jgi:hypothetical protein
MVVRILHKVLDMALRPLLLEPTPERPTPSIGRTQAAFRAQRSTYEQAMVLQMVQAVHRESFSTKRLLIGVFLDIKKAFDSIEYADLLDILEGTHHLPPPWLEALRKLLPGNETSILGIPVAMLRGLPQGGALCPLLCNAFMEDLARDLAQHIEDHPQLSQLWRERNDRAGNIWDKNGLKDLWLRLLQFADDVAILARTPQEAQQLLDVVTAWGQRRHLVFSFKSFATFLSLPPRAQAGSHPELRVGDVALQWHPEDQAFKYLGVTTQAARSQPHRVRGGKARAALDEQKTRAALHGLYQMFQVQRRQYYVVPVALRLGIEQVVHAKALYDTAIVDLDYDRLDQMVMGAVRHILQVPPTTPTAFLRWELRLWPSKLRAHKRAISWAHHCWHHTWIGTEVLQPALIDNGGRGHPIFAQGPVGRLTRILSEHGLSWMAIHGAGANKVKAKHDAQSRLDDAFTQWAIEQLKKTGGLPDHHREQMLRTMGLDAGNPTPPSCRDLPLYLYLGEDLPRAGLWTRLPYLRYQFRGVQQRRASCAWCGRADQEHGYHLIRCSHMPPRLLRRRNAVLVRIHQDIHAATLGPYWEPDAVSDANLDHLFHLRWPGRGSWKKAGAQGRRDSGHQACREVLTEALWYMRDMLNTYRRSTAGSDTGGANPVWALPVYGEDPYHDPGPHTAAENVPLPRAQPAPTQIGDSLLNLAPPQDDAEEHFGFSPDAEMGSS